MNPVAVKLTPDHALVGCYPVLYETQFPFTNDKRVEEITKWGKYRFLDDKQMLLEIPPELFGYLADGVKKIYLPRVVKDRLILPESFGDMVYVKH